MESEGNRETRWDNRQQSPARLRPQNLSGDKAPLALMYVYEFGLGVGSWVRRVGPSAALIVH